MIDTKAALLIILEQEPGARLHGQPGSYRSSAWVYCVIRADGVALDEVSMPVVNECYADDALQTVRLTWTHSLGKPRRSDEAMPSDTVSAEPAPVVPAVHGSLKALDRSLTLCGLAVDVPEQGEVRMGWAGETVTCAACQAVLRRARSFKRYRIPRD